MVGSQTEIDHLLNSAIVLRNITYGLSVYGAADSELTTIQRFKAKSSLPMLYNYKIGKLIIKLQDYIVIKYLNFFCCCHKNSWKLTQMLMFKSKTWRCIIATKEK